MNILSPEVHFNHDDGLIKVIAIEKRATWQIKL